MDFDEITSFGESAQVVRMWYGAPPARRTLAVVTTDNTATGWRDIADQLTPGQIENLECFESAAADTAILHTTLLAIARRYASDNLNGAMMFPEKAAPPDAMKMYARREADDDGVWSREFEGMVRHIGLAEILVVGKQFSADDRCERSIIVGIADQLTTAQARELAAALLNTADEIDGAQP
jgi:hypothetical protein